MPTLHVRSVPPQLYRRIERLAAASNRSLSGEVVQLLASALGREEARARQTRILAGILRRARRRRGVAGVPGSVAMIRELRGGLE